MSVSTAKIARQVSFGQQQADVFARNPMQKQVSFVGGSSDTGKNNSVISEKNNFLEIPISNTMKVV